VRVASRHARLHKIATKFHRKLREHSSAAANRAVMVPVMTRGIALIGKWPLAQVIFALAAGLMSFDPIEWLINTWLEPAYESTGLYIFAGVAALFLWSLTSRSERTEASRKPLALTLFALMALVRLIGQELAANSIGGLALAIDVYAFGACLISRGLHDNVRCRGLKLLPAGTDVLVDLPFSGARTLMLLLLGFCLLGLFRGHRQEILQSTRSSADPAFQVGLALP